MLTLALPPGHNTVAAQTNENGKTLYRDESFSDKGSRLWSWIKGRRARNAILFGMWSYHMLGSGEFFGDGTYNEQNHLLGIQFEGFTCGTFINSFNDRAFFAGLARDIDSVSYTANTRVDTGYKVGLMHGYRNNLPSVYGISPQLKLTLGLSWRKFGIDLGWTPVVASLNFRIDLE